MEAGRVSVAIEATGLEAFQKGFAENDRIIAGYAASAQKHVGGIERAMASTERAAGGYSRSMAVAGRSTDAFGRQANTVSPGLQKIQQGLDRAGLSADRAGSRLTAFATSLASIYTAQRLGAGFIGMSDEATRLAGRLQLVTNSAAELADVEQRLFDVSQRTRTAFSSNVELYSRSAQALRDYGASQEQILTFTETLNQAFRISGATGQEASNAIIQLSQGLASGTLRGEEYNSIAEQGARVTRALSDALGVSIGELRELAQTGRLTTEVVFTALLSQAPKVAQEFTRVPRTVSEAMTQLRNDMLRTVGEVNSATGSTERLVGEIDRLRDIVRTTDFQSTLAFIAGGIANVMEDTRDLIGVVRDAGDATRDALRDLYNGAIDFFADIVVGAISAANEMVTAFSNGIHQLSGLLGVELPNPFARLDFDTVRPEEAILALKTAADDASAAVTEIAGETAAAGGAAAAASTEFSGLGESVADTEKKVERATRTFERQRATLAETVAGLQRQVSMLGASEGAMAAADLRARELARAWDTAREAGLSAIPAATLAAIDDAAVRVGGLTDQINALNEAQQRAEQVAKAIADLDFQNSLFGMSDADREIATTLRQLQVSYESMDGQRIAGAVRYRAEQERVQEQLETQNQFVENVLSTSLDALFNIGKAESWGDAVMGIFADIGRQYQELAKQNLMQALFGQNYTTGQLAPGQRSIAQPGFPAGFGSVPVAANQNMPASGALNIGAVQALNTNLQRSSRSALDVARQFDGLNERADSAVLDSFMQASGNWNNLSAADTAWCAAFANAAIAQAGGRGTNSNLASSFMNWGQGTNAPQVGDIVVLKPQSAGASGHVGFVAGFGDGKVQVFGGNQSNAANTRSFGLDQVRGYRTGVGVGGVGIGGSFAMPQMAAPVYAPQMSGAAQQAMAQGWSGFGPVPGQAGRSTVGMFGQGGRLQQFMQSPIGQLGMQGIGAFGAGYSSGSTGGGALQGGLGAFLSSGFNPVAGVVGLVGGALGGLFGGRAKRRQEHQQKAQAWEQMSPQWEEYQRMLRADSGPASGLRAAYGAIDQQMVDFVRVGSAAWKNGKNNSSALFDQVSQSRVGYQQRTNQAFAGGFDASVRSLNAGQGMESPFIQARDGIVEVGKSLLTFVDDARIVFGDGSEQVQKATEASVAQLRAMVSGSNELTEVGTALEVLAGAGNALGNQLMQLGVSFDDATREVGEAAHLMITRIRGDFVQGIEDQIAALDGKSYLADVRETIANIDLMLKDAAALNVDRSLVDNIFAKQAQAIVNGAELTGEAFADLVTKFPRLAGVVTEFSAAAEEAAQSIEDALNGVAQQGLEQARGLLERSYSAEVDRINDVIRARRDEIGELERTKSATEQFKLSIRTLLDDLLTDPNLSPLSAQDRLGEAERQYRETLAKAMAGDETARGDLASDSQRYLDEARSFWASSEQYGAIFQSVRKSLEGAEAKAGREITEAQRQIDRLETLIKADEASLTIMQEQYNALLKIDTSVVALADAMRMFATARTAADDAAAKAGASTGLSKSQQYLANNADVLSAVAGGYTFGLPSGSSLDAIVKAHFDQFGQFEGRKYAMGGLVSGPGSGTSDSIRAMLSNGEYVVPAARVPANLPALEAMRVGRPISADNGNSQMAAELKALREENSRLLRTLISTTGGGLADVKSSSDRNARAAEQVSLAERRRTNNRQAA